MNDSETFDFEGRRYVSPTLSSNEQLAFVDALRNVVDMGNSQARRETEALGTRISSNLGGLTGSEGYFAQRYQTTPVQATAGTLKATAQAKALNDLMGNYQAQMKNRVTQAYRNARRRASTSGGSEGSEDEGFSVEEPEAYGQTSTLTVEAEQGAPATRTTTDIDGKYFYSRTLDGRIYNTNDPNLVLGSDGYFYSRSGAKRLRTLDGWKDVVTDSSGNKVYLPIK